MASDILRGLVRHLIPHSLRRGTIAKRTVVEKSGGVVMSGPFRGMKYLTHPDDFVDYTMLLGTYELEIRPALSAVLTGGRFKNVIDVGSAQGYYVVGLAMVRPDLRLVAFETNPKGREQTVRMAEANAVGERIEIRGLCEPASLRDVLRDPARTFLIMDIDGGEEELLDPAKVPELASVCVLLEVHDMYVPGVSDLIRDRFRSTHDIEHIPVRLRTLADLPFQVPSLLGRGYLGVLRERSPGNDWLFMRPKPKSNDPH